MVNAINSNVNAIQFFNATNAFKASSLKPAETFMPEEPEISDGITDVNNEMLKELDVPDVRKYASSIGEEVSDDDIKYGLTYGRSVLADWVV